MNPAVREKLAILVAPALLVGIVWGLFVRPTDAAKSLAHNTETERTKAAPPTALPQARSQFAASQQEAHALDVQKDALVVEWKALGSDEQARHAHATLVERLSTLLRANN